MFDNMALADSLKKLWIEMVHQPRYRLKFTNQWQPLLNQCDFDRVCFLADLLNRAENQRNLYGYAIFFIFTYPKLRQIMSSALK